MTAVAAILVLGASIGSGCAGRQTAADLADRAERIAVLIERAEQMGARNCAPRELARAKVSLERALHEMAEGHYPAGWTRKEFDKVETMASALLNGRIMAQRTGFTCYKGGG